MGQLNLGVEPALRISGDGQIQLTETANTRIEKYLPTHQMAESDCRETELKIRKKIWRIDYLTTSTTRRRRTSTTTATKLQFPVAIAMVTASRGARNNNKRLERALNYLKSDRCNLYNYARHLGPNFGQDRPYNPAGSAPIPLNHLLIIFWNMQWDMSPRSSRISGFIFFFTFSIAIGWLQDFFGGIFGDSFEGSVRSSAHEKLLARFHKSGISIRRFPNHC